MAEVLKAIGLMSGTSMDGIDVALIETDGEAIVKPGPSMLLPYGPAQRGLIAGALEDALAIRGREERPGRLTQAEEMITAAHTSAVRQFLAENSLNPSDIALIGFHGQTVLHRPDARLTVQIGSGKDLASGTGIRVVGDMRAADVAAGGQGAPLVPVFHRALSSALAALPAVFVNIGGVANVTFVGSDGALLAFDTGPGNALIDDWVSSQSDQAIDEGGRLAAAGRDHVNDRTVEAWLQNGYFDIRPPKSLDRNHDWGLSLDGLSLEAGAALLTSFTAQSIARSAAWFPETPKEWVICGGGRHNAETLRLLREQLSAKVSVAEDYGFDGDAIEAQAFAYLAVRSLQGRPLTFPGTTACPQAMTGGVTFEPA